MRGAAGLDPDQARRKRAEKRKRLAAFDRLGDHDPALRVDGVNLEHVLGQIQPDACDRRQIADRAHGWLPFRWRFRFDFSILAHRDADRGAVHPITVTPRRLGRGSRHRSAALSGPLPAALGRAVRRRGMATRVLIDSGSIALGTG
jgi:hypothetical protein